MQYSKPGAEIAASTDPAILAAENARLVQELAKSRQQQVATSEILGIISRSPTDLQPVLDAVATSAARLCEAFDASIYRLDSDRLRLVAHHGPIPHDQPVGEFIVPLVRGTTNGRAVLDKRTVHVADMQAEVEEFPEASQYACRFGNRTSLSVPMMRGGVPIGTIHLRRTEAQLFTERQVALLQTFADQAVIAIENARLFEDVQAKTRELTESLEYQTATSEVLNVISRSPNELQPVLDTIVQTARRLCGAERAIVCMWRDGKYHLVSHDGVPPDLVEYLTRSPFLPDRGSSIGRVALERKAVQIPNVLTDAEWTGFERARIGKVRTALGVPLLRKGEVIGVIAMTHTEVKPFTDKQTELVTTFADQAVIAINNVGLFEEVQARNRDLTALGEVGRAVSSTLDLKVVLKTIVDRAVDLSGTDACSIFYYRQEVGRFELGETSGLSQDVVVGLRKLNILARETGLGEAIARRQPLQLPDVTKRASNPLRDAALDAGLRAALIVPLLGAVGPLGALVLQRRQPGEFPISVVNLMQSFADQSAIALENARLFEEIAQKSRELEIASQHKSQFVANMSHELRTPLAAMLGYGELLRDGAFGELPEKAIRIVERVQVNGKHLLGLINSVLDISKIEAGQFRLNLSDYSLPTLIETVRIATESLAGAKSLALTTEVATDLPHGFGDEQRLSQVLLNLVGNAIKFTDRGEVCVTARCTDGQFLISVRDTGPGIPLEEQQRIFEEFHQVDGSSTRAKGGSGLGLAIAKQIVEMHGGSIWVESTLGQGAVFNLKLPVQMPQA
jgi:signal transduction histidine kinase/putative methionine-R-sulfoxide reductase with GAF domain